MAWIRRRLVMKALDDLRPRTPGDAGLITGRRDGQQIWFALYTSVRADLVRHPNNGWALFGLAQSLTAQKKTAEAVIVERQFTDAWRYADVKLAASAF